MKLSLVRQDVAAIVATAMDGVTIPELAGTSIPVIDHLPDSIATPCVLIAWSDPWLTPSTLCAWTAKVEIIVVAQRIEPGGKLETLEDMTSTIVVAVKSSGIYTVDDVSSPYPLQVGGVDYLATSINVTHELE